MYSVNHLNFSNVEMTLIALIEQKTRLKFRCGVRTLNEVQNVFFNSPSIKKRKLSTMLCRHFYHVPPWAVISSSPTWPFSWGSEELQGFFSKVWGPSHQHPWHPTKTSWQLQALLTCQTFHEEQCPPVCLPLLASHARGCLLCWPGAWSGLFCSLTVRCPRWNLHCALVWWLVGSIHLMQSQLLGQGSGCWRDLWDVFLIVWEGYVWAGILASQAEA